MSKDVSLISYDKEIETISKYEHYSADFHNTFGDIRSLHVRLTPLIAHSIADYYEDRNKAMHAGDRSRITKQKLKEVQEISRKVIKAELVEVKNWLQTHQGGTFERFKDDEVRRISNIRDNYISNGNLDRTW